MDWNLRAEILEVTHRWSLVALFILAGSLIGGLFAYLLPDLYQAESSLLVSYNADIHPRNPDDYKNWQMEQLNAFILSEEVVQETLNRLKGQDPGWNGATLNDLNTRLKIYWRNVGEWRLVAEGSNPQQASLLLDTWEGVALEKLEAAHQSALATLNMSTQLDEIATQQVENKMRSAGLVQIQQALDAWMSESRLEQPLESLERWRLVSSVSRIVAWDPAGVELLQDAPPADASPSAYIPWLEEAVVMAQQEQSLLETQYSQLAMEYDQLYAEWSEEQNSSGGLTAYLVVEPKQRDGSHVQPVRSTSRLAFVGGLVGLLVWGLVWLGRPLLQVRAKGS